MATVEQQEELIQAIKRPDRYYRITINGYGGESSYMSVSKQAHDFWKPVVEEHGDADLVHYMVSSEDDEYDFDYIDDVPDEAHFMIDEDGDARPWYEPPEEFEHTFGADYDSAMIEINEVDGEDYESTLLDTVLEHQEVAALADEIYENSGEEYIEIQEYSCCDEAPSEYVAQMFSSEKGTFFDGVLHLTNGEQFDPAKLRLQVVEYLNGEDTIVGVTYNGNEVDNDGGDTTGKGYYADIWKAN